MTIITSNHDYRQSMKGCFFRFQIGYKGKKWILTPPAQMKDLRHFHQNNLGMVQNDFLEILIQDYFKKYTPNSLQKILLAAF
jgi:hypothetical protein